MCGGTSTPEESLQPTINENQNTTPEVSQEESIPPIPSVNFDIIDIYNSKLVNELCSDAQDIDSTSEECLRQYRDLIDDLLSALENIDKDLIEQAYKDDKEIEYETSKGMRSNKISFILSMMIFHATEHRAQIVAALDKNNERSINLDEYSIFGYVQQQR